MGGRHESHVFGNQLLDITALLKLQKQMLEESEDIAVEIVYAHMKPALKALDLLKDVKNTTLQTHVDRLRKRWYDMEIVA